MDANPIALITEKPKIMIVDDSVTNLTIAKRALEESYQVIPVTSGSEALRLLVKVSPSLILLDVDMPGMDGFETIRRIKSSPATHSIPVIFLTAKDDSISELEGLRLGAVDYITKPFSIPLLLQRILLHIELINQRKKLEHYNLNLAEMVREKTEIIAELQHAIIHTLTNLIECRDGLTGSHIVRSEKYLEVLVESVLKSGKYQDEFSGLNIRTLLDSSQLHDIGKIAISDTILQKPGRLTPEEYEKIKIHTIIGEQAIKSAMQMTRDKTFLECAAVISISHHEKWDGSGYPYGLKGTQIPFVGRLMAVADVYDALVSTRPYKPSYPHAIASQIIISEAGKHFDPVLVDIFAENQHLFAQATNTFALNS